MPHLPSPESGVLHARHVVTLTPGLEGESVWWEGGRIRVVGSAVQVERSAPKAVLRYDAPQCLGTPGLTDGHTHLGMWALNRSRVELAGLRSREEVLERVAAAEPQ